MNSHLKTIGGSVRLSGLLGILLCFAGCQIPGSPPAFYPPGGTNAAPNSVETPDLLRPGDILIITFSGLGDPPPKHEDRVREDGCIRLPFIGDVKAAGRTRAELQAEITRKYVPDYYKRLDVNVNSDARYYYVYGEVKQPRNYMYPGTMTVLRAIAAASDFNDFANRKKVQLIRSNGQKPIIINCVKAQKNPELDLPVYPEDRVYVPRRWF